MEKIEQLIKLFNNKNCVMWLKSSSYKYRKFFIKGVLL